jgi:predicted ATP-dependent endonuclease of OLD family
MYLEKLTIEGYKNFCTTFNITFSKGLNVIVGENGVGKTAIIDAMRLLLLEDEFGRTPISDTDFHRPFKKPQNQVKSFRIAGSLGDLTSEQKIAFLPWTDLNGHASLTLICDNKPNRQGKYKRILWGGKSRSSVFEWELLDKINCTYLPPLRDAEAKLREGKNSRLARLLKNMNSKELKETRDSGTLHPLETKVKEFNDSLVADPDQSITKANKLISTRLIEALGPVFGQDTHIQFSETNFGRIVESLRMFFFPEANTSCSRDMFRSLEENSLGYNNLLYIATVLAELTYDSDEGYLKVLLIEEPEAHLHPQLQIRLLKYLEMISKNRNVQVVVTTHSPVLASSVSLESLIHISLTKDMQGNDIYNAIPINSCGLSDNSNKFLDRWLDATKSNLLFAKGVILVEGIAEAMFLPILAKNVLTNYNLGLIGPDAKRLPSTLIDGGISVINMNGIYFRHFMQLFCNINTPGKNNIPIRCAGLTDHDPEPDAKPTPSNPSVSINNRDLQFQEIINTSVWARLYANPLKTFEYDLAMESNNMKTMYSVAKSLVDTDGTVKIQMEEYENVEWSTSTENAKADAAYYLLKHIDKGEFSQALAEAQKCPLLMNLIVPEYIKNAVIWACGGTV